MTDDASTPDLPSPSSDDEDFDNSGPCERCPRHIPFADDFRCGHCAGCDSCCDCEPDD